MSYFCDLSLARRLERHAMAAMEAFAGSQAKLFPETRATQIEVAGARAVFAGVESPLTKVTGLGMSQPVGGVDMQAIEDFYAGRDARASIDLCPFADPSLVERLGDRGYRINEFLNMWVCELSAHDLPVLAFPEGLEVHEAGDADFDVWMGVVARGFSEKEVPGPEDIHIAASVGRPSRRFLAFLNGVPAGGGAMSVRDGLAYYYSGSTIPAYRNRGIQTALVRALMHASFEAGCDMAMVMTVPGSTSQRNFERHEFRLAYTLTNMVK